MSNLLDYHAAISTIANKIQSNINKAPVINSQENLGQVTLGAHDELFHQNQPVLTGVDISSLYCYLLSQEQQRDGDTWAIRLWDLENKGFAPERIIADDGDGLRAGHKLTMPSTPCDIDNFHLTKMLMELRCFFRNRLKTGRSEYQAMEIKMEKAKQKGASHKVARKLGVAKRTEAQARYLSKTIDTLVSWMEHDVLNKAGPDLKERKTLYDFIVDELQKLEAIHPHRIHAARITLKNQRDCALAYVQVMEDKFQTIAARYNVPLTTMWQLCLLQRCQHGW